MRCPDYPSSTMAENRPVFATSEDACQGWLSFALHKVLSWARLLCNSSLSHLLIVIVVLWTQP